MILANFAPIYCLALVHASSSLWSLLQAGWWRLATMQQARGIRALQQQWVCEPIISCAHCDMTFIIPCTRTH